MRPSKASNQWKKFTLSIPRLKLKREVSIKAFSMGPKSH